jgi:hypothetical protein
MDKSEIYSSPKKKIISTNNINNTKVFSNNNFSSKNPNINRIDLSEKYSSKNKIIHNNNKRKYNKNETINSNKRQKKEKEPSSSSEEFESSSISGEANKSSLLSSSSSSEESESSSISGEANKYLYEGKGEIIDLDKFASTPSARQKKETIEKALKKFNEDKKRNEKKALTKKLSNYNYYS